MDGYFRPNYSIKFYNKSPSIVSKDLLRQSQLKSINPMNNQSYRNTLRNSNLYNSISVNNVSSAIPNPSILPSYRSVYSTLQNTSIPINYFGTGVSNQVTSNPNSIVLLPVQTSSSSDFNSRASLASNSYIQQPILLNTGLNAFNIGIVNSPYFAPTSLQPVTNINTTMPMVLYNGYINNLSNNTSGQYILNYQISQPVHYKSYNYSQSQFSSQSSGYELDSYEPDVEDNLNKSMEIGPTEGTTQEIKNIDVNSNEFISNYNLKNDLTLTENQAIVEDKNYTYEVVSQGINPIIEVPSIQIEDYNNYNTNIDYNTNEIYSSGENVEYKFEPLDTISNNNAINYDIPSVEPKVEEIVNFDINTTQSIPEEKTVYVQDLDIDLTNVQNLINPVSSDNYTTFSINNANPSIKNDTYTYNSNYLESNPIEENNVITSIEFSSEYPKNNYTNTSKPLESIYIKKSDIDYYLASNDINNNNSTPFYEAINPIKSYDISSNLLELDSLNKIYDSYQLTSNPIENNIITSADTSSIPINETYTYTSKPIISDSLKKSYTSYSLTSNKVKNNKVTSVHTTSKPSNENYVYNSEPLDSDPLKKSYTSYYLTSNNVKNNKVTYASTTSKPLNENYVYNSEPLDLDPLQKSYTSYHLVSNPTQTNKVKFSKPIVSKPLKKSYASYYLTSNPVQNNKIDSINTSLNTSKKNYVYTSKPIVTNPLKKSYTSYYLTSNPVQNYSYTSKPLISKSITKSETSYYLTSNPVQNNKITSVHTTSNPSINNYTFTSKPIKSHSIRKSDNSYYFTSKNYNPTYSYKSLNPLQRSYSYTSKPLLSNSLKNNYTVNYPIVSTPTKNNIITSSYTTLNPLKRSSSYSYTFHSPVYNSIRKSYSLKPLVSSPIPIQNNNITPIHSSLNPLKRSFSYTYKPLLSNSLRRTYAIYPLVSSPIQYNNISSSYNALNPLKRSYSYSTQPVLSNSLRRTYAFYPLVSSPVSNYNVTAVPVSSNPLKRSFSYTSHPIATNSLRRSYNIISHPSLINGINNISVPLTSMNNTYAHHPLISGFTQKNYDISHPFVSNPLLSNNSVSVPKNISMTSYNPYHPTISSSLNSVLCLILINTLSYSSSEFK